MNTSKTDRDVSAPLPVDEQIARIIEQAQEQGLQLTGEGGLLPDMIKAAVEAVLRAEMAGPDAGDHVHAAAARGGRVDVLHPGDLFGELAAAYPIELGRVIAEMAAHRRRPPMTPDDILDRLTAQGLHAMVSALRPSPPDEPD